jgi:hypothetical protein
MPDLQARLGEIERELQVWHRSNDIAKRLSTIPGCKGRRQNVPDGGVIVYQSG